MRKKTMEVIPNGMVNWDADWSNCYQVFPKKGKMRWCQACFEYHDLACFFHFRGGMMGCMLNKSCRSKAMAKIKGQGGIGAKK